MAALAEDPEANIDFAGKTPYDVYPEPLADTLFRRDEEVLAEGRSTHEVQRVEVADGSHRWIDNRKYPLKSEDGGWSGCSGSVRTSPSRSMRGASWQRPARFSGCSSSMRLPAIAMFDREMRYLAVSRRWLEDRGIAGAQVIGALPV